MVMPASEGQIGAQLVAGTWKTPLSEDPCHVGLLSICLQFVPTYNSSMSPSHHPPFQFFRQSNN
jgi:hypothetical protein